MAYNNGFPVGYNQLFSPINPYYQPQMQQMMMQQSQEQTGPIWVQGEAGAKSYLVGPGKTVPLWDSESQVIYMKTADQSGMPSMKILDYTIRDDSNLPPKAPASPAAEYATKNEIEKSKDELKHEIIKIKKENDDLKKQINAIKESLGIE